MSRRISILNLAAGGLLLLGSITPGPGAWAAGYGFDAGQSLEEYAHRLGTTGFSGENGTWVRMRGLAGSGGEGGGPMDGEGEDREALRALHQRGAKVCVILRWDSAEWKAGVRAGAGHRLPVDLREAFERTKRLSETYGDLVDAWEIENEPDIGFVADNPEVMAAFQKACYLGIKAGARNAELGATSYELRAKSWELGAGSPELGAGCFQSAWLAQKRGWGLAPSSKLPARSALVLPPPMALPPGPYFERLWANGVSSYIDAFNYHYYGYVEDFTGVYWQFEEAIEHLSGKARGEGREASGGNGAVRKLPVFLTEYGYGLMDGTARNTVEGRVRQWRWFATVADQIRTLRPEGPMAFVLNPYYEAELNEFGLLMKRPSRAGAPDAKKPPPSDEGAPLVFTPADFGSAISLPWMRRIGAPEGAAYASPALAYLEDYAAEHPYRGRSWGIKAPPPSPVVIDFVAGDDMRAAKDYGGYWLKGEDPSHELRAISYKLGAESYEPGATSDEPGATSSKLMAHTRTGHGRVVLYNFSSTEMTGDLVFSPVGPITVTAATGGITLAPGERRELPVELAVDERVFAGHELRMRFQPRRRGETPAVYATWLYPAGDRMVKRRVADFAFSAQATAASRATLLARPLADGEPPLHADGRWLVSDGVAVGEAGGVWRFDVSRFPAQPLRPAMVELPLPADFAFPRDTMLWFQHREVPPTAASARGADSRPEIRPDGKTPAFDVYFRTANGNLYQAVYGMPMGATWTTYGQCAQNLTMAFWGRAALPWRFADNRPVSLVFFFRRANPPFAVEIRQAEIARFTRNER